MDVEAKIAAALGGIVDIQSHLFGLQKPPVSIGERILSHPQFKAFAEKRVDVLTVKSAITGTGAAADPLVRSGKPFIDPGVRRPLTIRQLLPRFPTLNGAIELPVKTSATNNAAPQNRENTSFGESAYEFQSTFIPVQTIAHFLPASRQIFEDAGTLDAFIRAELLAGLAEAVEDQLLTGDGTNSALTGLLDNATALTQTSPLTTSEIDIIRMAIEQVRLSKFRPNAIILNPADWADIETAKGTSLYLAGQPKTPGGLWGLPVVESTAIASGTFLVGDFSRAAVLFEREPETVEIARSEGNNFTTGMITARAFERLALVVTNPAAMRTGAL